MSFADKLNEAKEKAELQEFEVTITETLQHTVIVTAKDRKEAEDIANNNWCNSDPVLDADNFVEVDFEARPVKSEPPVKGVER